MKNLLGASAAAFSVIRRFARSEVFKSRSRQSAPLTQTAVGFPTARRV